MNQREMHKTVVSLVAERGRVVSPDMQELTLLATSEWGALLDALAAVSMDLSHIAESKSIPEKANVERLRFDLIVIDAVATELKKAGGLDFVANAV